MHRQVPSPLPALGSTLIGIPLAIRAHRRETSAGVAMALMLVIIYYAFVIVGQALRAGRVGAAPDPLGAELLFQAVGAVLLWRANRGV